MGLFMDKTNKNYVPDIAKQYVVQQVILMEKIGGVGKSANLSELESVINIQAQNGYRLHTMTTAQLAKSVHGSELVQATLVFEKIRTEDPSYCGCKFG